MATKSVLIPYDKYRRLLSGNRPTSHECGDVQKRQERHRLPKRRISVTPPRRPSPETREGPTLKRPPLPASENEDSTSPETEVPAEAAGTIPPGETGELRSRSADVGDPPPPPPPPPRAVSWDPPPYPEHFDPTSTTTWICF